MTAVYAELEDQKRKCKKMCQMNCCQASAQEKLIEEKDAEIDSLKRRLTDLETAGFERRRRTSQTPPSLSEIIPSGQSSTSGLESPPLLPLRECPEASHCVERQSPIPRVVVPRPESTPWRGKVPPIDYFSGESAEFCLEDWLPSLERAVEWNGWNETEKLIQLAGHLRGKTLKEWNLLYDDEKSTYHGAVERLRDVLGPGSCILAAQDFCHTARKKTSLCQHSFGDWNVPSA